MNTIPSREQIEAIVAAIVEDVDYDYHKEKFKYSEDDNGVEKERLFDVALGALKNLSPLSKVGFK